jgi:hypothetical protein
MVVGETRTRLHRSLKIAAHIGAGCMRACKSLRTLCDLRVSAVKEQVKITAEAQRS